MASAGWFDSSTRAHLDEYARGREGEVVAGDFADGCANGEQHVGILEQLGCEAILDPGSCGERMPEGERPLAADSAHNGGIQ